MVVWILLLVWCGKQKEIIKISAEPIKETIEVEMVEVCQEATFPAYRWKMDMLKTLSAKLQDYQTATITAKFSEDFVNNYKYEDSQQFFFALKVFIWDNTSNWWYYNVLRTQTNSVRNWKYLTWAVPANQLKDGFTRNIPLQDEIYLASSEYISWRQFSMVSFSRYFSDDITKIGAYISSVKELKGWEIADITIKLCK